MAGTYPFNISKRRLKSKQHFGGKRSELLKTSEKINESPNRPMQAIVVFPEILTWFKLANAQTTAITDEMTKMFCGLCLLRLRPFLTRKFFQEILGLEGSQNFLGKFRQVHNLKISDRLLRSKSFFQENIPGFICSVFRSA